MDRDDDKPPTRGRRAAVMSDVGQLAGVSHQTVSRVINGSRHVRPETRERVLAAMRELDYRPNSVARALVTGRSNTLGVVTFDTTLYGPAATLYGVERAAHEAGYFIIVASLKAMDRSSVPEAIERLRRQGVDGLLVITPQEQSAEALLHAPSGDTPLVAVEAGPNRAVPVVAIDQVAGAASATRHLLDLGHETVWHISGPPDFLESRQRLDGWRATLEQAGAEAPPPLVGDWSPRAGYELGRRLTERAVGHGDLRRQRPDGARRAACDARGRARGSRATERRRLRRHPGGAVLLASADDGSPGLRRDGQPQRAAAPARCSRPASPSRAGPAVLPRLIVRASTAVPPG